MTIPRGASRWFSVAVVSCALASGCARGRSPRAAFDRAIFGDIDGDPVRRSAALVARLTLPEKVAQLETAAPAIPRLGVPAYDWWNESLHGVGRHGVATVFPQAIGLAATFDEDLVRRIADAIAHEARAKFDAAGSRWKGSARYGGLTFFAPNVNIFRDPRWGRGQETYGEDPLLTARLGVAYVRGLQGDDRRRLRAAAVGKHFAVHSGPELDRHRFDARVTAHDLADTYLPQFEALVRDAHVSGIMAAYNRVNGQPCVASPLLLDGTLRRGWGFDGFVVGDCGAVGDLVGGHHAATDGVHAAALALRAGTDLDCGTNHRALAAAVAAGLVSEAEIDRAATRLFAVRFRLGLFDPPPTSTTRPGSDGGDRAAKTPGDYTALAREAARESLVLLENKGGVLPIRSGVRRIAVVGPTADDIDVLLGNYHGDPHAPVTLLAGISAAARRRGIAVDHAAGVTLAGRSLGGLPAALAAVRAADLVVAVLGLSPRLEGEEGDPDSANPSGDRRDLGLPGAQSALLNAILRLGKPTIVVLTGGGAIALPPTARPPDALLMAWYPGEQGGNAVADVLFGDVAPSGRLPVTFYRSVDDLPPFADYGMAGRTYRYFRGRPAYAFGYGLTTHALVYEDMRLEVVPAAVSADPDLPAGFDGRRPSIEAGVTCHLRLANPGPMAVAEVIQIYAAAEARLASDPLRALVAFRRVSLAAGATQTVDIRIPARQFSRVDSAGVRSPVSGVWNVRVGGTTTTTTVALPPGWSAQP